MQIESGVAGNPGPTRTLRMKGLTADQTQRLERRAGIFMRIAMRVRLTQATRLG
jgi:hypothetical protein